LQLKKFLDSSSLETIFSPSLVPILFISDNIVSKLKNQLPYDEPEKYFMVGSVFNDALNNVFLKSYTNFTIMYESSRVTLIQAMSNQDFVNFKKNAEKNPECHNHGLEDYLISVIQRIPQYIMLLSQLTECTPTGNKDYTAICNSVKKLKEIAEEINTKKKSKDNYAIINKIHNELGIKKIPKSRELIYDDIVYDILTNSKQELAALKTNYHIYIFNDIIAIGKFTINSNHQTLEDCIQHQLNINFEDILDNEKSFKLGETLYYARNTLLHRKLCDHILNTRKNYQSPNKKK